MERDIVQIAGRMAAEANRLTATVIDRVRDQIGREDTEAWNALITASFQLRLEASKRETAALSPQREDTGEYVRAPREPTEAMLRAAEDHGEYIGDAWSAMLAAAPPAPTEGVERALPTRDEIKVALQASKGWPRDLHPGPAADAVMALIEGRSA